MTQAAILILSAAAMWLVSGRSRHARLGWALGLASQPFWLYATFEAGQWGMFALAVFYSFAWANGLWNHWAGNPKADWMRAYEKSLNERAKVEQELIDCANGKRTLPGKEQCREWAMRLGVPAEWRARA